jgi:hypothetical protein
VGENTWVVGCKDIFMLIEDLMGTLHEKEIFTLSQVV